MALKKQHFAEGEIPIFDEACIYKRGEYWQFRMWLPKENKYARKSLRTRSEATAIEKGKAAYLEIYANLQQGKTYFYHRHKATNANVSYKNRGSKLHQKTMKEQTSHLSVRSNSYEINKLTEKNTKNHLKDHVL